LIRWTNICVVAPRLYVPRLSPNTSSGIVHDWDDEKTIAILKIIRGAIAPL
jgi:hypothetical protein